MIALVYALFADKGAAEAMAWRMVEQKLAACANMLAPCQSIYPWQGRIEQAEEVPVLFKTSLARQDALIAAIAAGHDYEIPAVTSWTARTSSDYRDWVERETTITL